MAPKQKVLTFLGGQETRLLVDVLLGEDYTVIHAPAGLGPLDAIVRYEPELVLVDMALPEVSGLEIVCRIHKDPLYRDLPLVGLGTPDTDGADKVALVAGCSGFLFHPLQAEIVRPKIRALLEGEREELDLREHLQYYRLFSEALIEKLENRLVVLEKKTQAMEEQRKRQNALTIQVLTSLVTLIEAKDPYLKGHSGRVTRFALALADRVGFGGEDLKILERAALLHDIGKISIDLKQINKPGKLNSEEWAVIRQHPETGYKILSSIDFLRDEALIIKFHHTRYEEWPSVPQIPSRIRTLTSIITLMDAFDAMTTHRSYNKPRTLREAQEELERCSGGQFDPALVESFIQLLEDNPPDPKEGVESQVPPGGS